jgi:hypothetical protein
MDGVVEVVGLEHRRLERAVEVHDVDIGVGNGGVSVLRAHARRGVHAACLPALGRAVFIDESPASQHSLTCEILKARERGKKRPASVALASRPFPPHCPLFAFFRGREQS